MFISMGFAYLLHFLVRALVLSLESLLVKLPTGGADDLKFGQTVRIAYQGRIAHATASATMVDNGENIISFTEETSSVKKHQNYFESVEHDIQISPEIHHEVNRRLQRPTGSLQTHLNHFLMFAKELSVGQNLPA